MRRRWYWYIIIALLCLVVPNSHALSPAILRGMTGPVSACAYTCAGTEDLDSEEPELFENADDSFCADAEMSKTECTTSDCINTYSTGWTGPSFDCVGNHTLEIDLDTDLADDGELTVDWTTSHGTGSYMYFGWSFYINPINNTAWGRLTRFPWILQQNDLNWQGGAIIKETSTQVRLHAYDATSGDSTDYWVLAASTEYRAVLKFQQNDASCSLALYDSGGTAVVTNGSSSNPITYVCKDVAGAKAKWSWLDYNDTDLMTIFLDGFRLADTLAEAKMIP